MRGSAMALGALVVVTGVCLLEVVMGDASMVYLVGAAVGGLCCAVYGFVALRRG